MLSRRQLRIKVLQALYSFFQAGKSDLAVAERELFRSIDKVNELYIYLLSFLIELAESDKADAGDVHLKFFPREEELNASHRFSEFRFFIALAGDNKFKSEVARTKVSWQNNLELIRKIFLEIKKSELYRNYLKDKGTNEKEVLIEITRKFVQGSEVFRNHIEEENIFWIDDYEFAFQLVYRTIRGFYESQKLDIIPLYKDETDDMEFVKKLFSQTILHNKDFEQSISERTKNWEVERIALMDILILKMALAELTSFPSIPVKVSINEFIDISKEYSTPKSKQFVNGIIDKLAADYKEQGKIVKTGRGLIN